MTILFGDITRAEREGYERGLRYALQLMDEIASGRPDIRLHREACNADARYLHEMRKRLEAELRPE